LKDLLIPVSRAFIAPILFRFSWRESTIRFGGIKYFGGFCQRLFSQHLPIPRHLTFSIFRHNPFPHTLKYLIVQTPLPTVRHWPHTRTASDSAADSFRTLTPPNVAEPANYRSSYPEPGDYSASGDFPLLPASFSFAAMSTQCMLLVFPAPSPSRPDFQ